MYVTAHDAGYRTAFVTLNWDGEPLPVRSMWANGWTLALQIEAIAEHYGVEKVDIVAHSKGGVDAQVAVVYCGAAPRVRNIFTLSSPHWGTEIADLGSDTGLGRLLLKLLGMDDAGIQFMTTRYMSFFRALTDGRSQDDDIRYYWAAGTDWGPKGTGLWFSGRYLAKNFGPNDGLVTVASAQLPGDNSLQLFVEPFDHYSISMGSTSFPYIDAIARQPVAPVSTALSR
jgi:pimeloyl-ACP methyl ester carboxylesterase